MPIDTWVKWPICLISKDEAAIDAVQMNVVWAPEDML